MGEEIEITVGSGNVFADLGLPNPEEAQQKSNLAYEINKAMNRRGLTHAQTAYILWISVAIVDNIIRGRLDNLTTEELTEYLNILEGHLVPVKGLPKGAITMEPTYTPQPINTSDVTLSPEVEALADKLAEDCHENWSAQRIRDGWTYGPQRNDDEKKHPCLVSYGDLSDTEKNYDFVTAMGTLKLITKLGYKIIGPDA